MSKKVEFRPAFPDLDIQPPVPASLSIPDWYKKTPTVVEGVITAKRCVPMIDSLSAGYVYRLPVDVEFSKDGKYTSNSRVNLVSSHDFRQTEQFEVSDAFNPQPLKWMNHWHIKTPRGYSMWFTHPVNRTDLPFYTLTGFVDTDRHPVITHFPFWVKNGWEGIIPAGTPIVQMVPIKREPWSGVVKDAEKAFRYVKEYEFMNPPFAMYRRKIWQKKRYS